MKSRQNFLSAFFIFILEQCSLSEVEMSRNEPHPKNPNFF